MSESQYWGAVRRELQIRSIPEGSVLLPTEQHPAWEGALTVTEASDGGWTIATVDYGRPRLLLRRTNRDDIVTALYQYLLTPLPPALTLSAEEREDRVAAATVHLVDLAARVRESGDLIVGVPAGVLLDRIGALDGYLLYPSDTSYEARALPPHVLRQPLQTVMTLQDVRVRATVTRPWFGQPGGGLRLELENQAMGVRDLVREGQLQQIAR